MPPYSKTGATLSEEELKNCYALRLSIVALKPETDPATDFEKFTTFVQKSQFVEYLTDNGEIKAFFATYFSEQLINGQKCLVIEPEYGFAQPDYRKGAYVRMTFARIVRSLKFKYWYKPIYIVGCAYPHSFIAFNRLFEGDFWTLESPNISELHKAILTNFLTRKTGKTAITSGVVPVPTLHKEQSPEHIAILQKNPFYTTYCAQNPDWTKGQTLAFVVRISWWVLLKSVFSTQSKIKNNQQSNKTVQI